MKKAIKQHHLEKSGANNTVLRTNMVLPHDVWYHYYDRPCEFCEEQIHMEEEDEWAECDLCKKLMCDECRNKIQCHVCMEKLERDEDPGISYVCEECIESCEACGGVTFHPACKKEHLQTCNRLGRAQRAVFSTTAKVEEKEWEVERTKRKLAELEEELDTAKKAKAKAETKLRKLNP